MTLIRQLPWDQSPVALQVPEDLERDARSPTYLLVGSTAHRIGNSPLFLGSQEDEGGRLIALPTEMPGVSRQHCSLTRKNGQCILEDHSRYGTFLNGHRIDGSSVLQVGDTIRIGTPGLEFQLITTDDVNG